MWDTNSGQCLRVLMGHSTRVTCFKISSPTKVVSGSEEGRLIIWDLPALNLAVTHFIPSLNTSSENLAFHQSPSSKPTQLILDKKIFGVTEPLKAPGFSKYIPLSLEGLTKNSVIGSSSSSLEVEDVRAKQAINKLTFMNKK